MLHQRQALGQGMTSFQNWNVCLPGFFKPDSIYPYPIPISQTNWFWSRLVRSICLWKQCLNGCLPRVGVAPGLVKVLRAMTQILTRDLRGTDPRMSAWTSGPKFPFWGSFLLLMGKGDIAAKRLPVLLFARSAQTPFMHTLKRDRLDWISKSSCFKCWWKFLKQPMSA